MYTLQSDIFSCDWYVLIDFVWMFLVGTDFSTAYDFCIIVFFVHHIIT